MEDIDREYYQGLLVEANLEIGRLKTALETVLNYSNDPPIIKMVEYALAQSPVSVSNGERNSG